MGPVFAAKARWQGATREHTPKGSVTEEQRRQRGFGAKTLRAAVLLSRAGVGSAVTARCGDAPASPPWPRPKPHAAGPIAIFRQALMFVTPLGPLGQQKGEDPGRAHYGSLGGTKGPGISLCVRLRHDSSSNRLAISS